MGTAHLVLTNRDDQTKPTRRCISLDDQTKPNSIRKAAVERKTRETEISLALTVDGKGVSAIKTGVGFLDHMLELFAKHSLMDLHVQCNGDTHVDAHHTTEDIGIALGQALDKALGDRAGIKRYGHMIMPMDETLVTCAVDLGGRPFCVFNAPMPTPRVGDFDSELVYDFWQGFSVSARLNLHVLLHYGRNTHHISEAIFKGMARTLRIAVEIDPRQEGIPSSKGVL